jgi:mRNA-degrading endonuclease RelE of RelBE toxin-antitoxin system
MYTPEYTEGVLQDLKALPAKERMRILNKIDEQLLHQPSQETRNKKLLIGLKPPWEHEQPVWELRVGKYRVFYDVDEPGQSVVIRAIRKKPPHQTTEQIL